MNEPTLSISVDVAVAILAATWAEDGPGSAVGIGLLLLEMGEAAPTTAFGLLDLIDALCADPQVQRPGQRLDQLRLDGSASDVLGSVRRDLSQTPDSGSPF